MQEMHRLLLKQISKEHCEDILHNDSYLGLIRTISRTYDDFESEQELLEHAMETGAVELIEANAQMMALIGSFPDALIVLDSLGQIMEVRSGISSLSMITSGRLVGTNINDLNFGNQRNFIAEAFSGFCCSGKIVRLEQPARIDQEEQYFDVRIVQLAEERALVVMRDITDQKRMEASMVREKERHRLMLENLGEGVISCNIEGRIELINTVAVQICGIDAKEAAGAQLTEVLNPINCPNFIDLITAQAIEQIPVQLHIRCINGQNKIITHKTNLIKLPGGPIDGLVMIIVDVTDELKQKSRLDLSRKLEGIGQLAAGIAHEINTPMQYIGDNLQFLKEAFSEIRALRSLLLDVVLAEGDLTPELANMHEIIKRVEQERDFTFLLEEIPSAIEQSTQGVEQVRDLVLALKEFSHPGNKTKQPEDLNHMIRNVVTISRNEWRHVANVTVDLDERLPMVPCVRDEINQVLLNVLVNAAQAVTEKHEACVSQGLPFKAEINLATSHIGQEARIEITDNGPGIPEDILDRIYDPFFTTKDVGKGTGQGLAIAYDIVVNKHGGTLWVESANGEGSIFTIVLPLDAGLQAI